jgi:hypothetical protein
LKAHRDSGRPPAEIKSSNWKLPLCSDYRLTLVSSPNHRVSCSAETAGVLPASLHTEGHKASSSWRVSRESLVGPQPNRDASHPGLPIFLAGAKSWRVAAGLGISGADRAATPGGRNLTRWLRTGQSEPSKGLSAAPTVYVHSRTDHGVCWRVWTGGTAPHGPAHCPRAEPSAKVLVP